MFNALKYIKKLEEVGFGREQAEAQLQIVIDVIEGELVTKEDFTNLKHDLKAEFDNLRNQMNQEFNNAHHEIKTLKKEMYHEFTRLEFRLVSKLGVLIVTSVSLAVALSTWLIKLK